MDTIKTISLLGLLVLMGFCRTAQAQVVLNWTDACDYPINIPSELVGEVDKLLEAEAIIVNTQMVDLLPNGDYMLKHMGPFDTWDLLRFGEPPETVPLCSNSIFYGETRVSKANTARSGFLIAPDILATTPHSTTWNPGNYYVIFGLHQGEYGSPCNTTIGPYIPADNVYKLRLGTIPFNTMPDADFMAFYLDRPVQGRSWLRMRSSGQPSQDDVLAIASHPMQLLTKFEYGVTYEGKYEDVGPDPSDSDDPDRPVFYNYHVAPGSSGSPVYNLTKGVVETAVRGEGPNRGVINNYLEDPPYECYIFADQYENDLPGIHPLPRPDALNIGRIEQLASMAPTLEPRLAPMEDKVYILPDDGSVQPPPTTYTVTASPYADWDIYVGAFIQPYNDGGPALLTDGVGMPFFDGNVEPGEVVSFTVDTDIPSGIACGIYDRYLGVAYSGVDDYIRHRFEIGLKEISVEPAEDWVDNDIGTPFTQTKTYTVHNVRPTPTTVWAYAGGPLPASVIQINGSNELVSVNLGPAGSATDSAIFEIGIDSSIVAHTDPETVYEMFVSFANADYQCAAQDIPFRKIYFKRGQRVFETTTGVSQIPPPVGGEELGDPVRFDIDLSNAPDACVGKVSLDVGFPYTGGGPSNIGNSDITLTSPSGLSAHLWASNDYTANYVFDEYVGSLGVTVAFLRLDDDVSPPLGPQLLEVFDDQRIKGHWYLDIRSDSGMFTSAAHRLNVVINPGTRCLGFLQN